MATQTTAALPTNFGKNQDTSTTGYSSGDEATDSISEATSGHGIVFNQAVSYSGGTGPLVGQSTPTVFHAGGVTAASTTTPGTDTTPATTVIYASEVYIENNATITGIALFLGSASGGNITVALADSAGLPIAAAQSATTAQSVTAGYQQIAFAAPYAAQGPARYFIMAMFDNTSARFRSHVLGNFRAGSVTGQTYGTFTTVAAIVGFTTNVGPIASTY
jgi:hypothetical protein